MFDIKRVTAPLQVTNGEGEEMPPVMNKSFLTFKFRFPLKAPRCCGHARPADPSAASGRGCRRLPRPPRSFSPFWGSSKRAASPPRSALPYPLRHLGAEIKKRNNSEEKKKKDRCVKRHRSEYGITRRRETSCVFPLLRAGLQLGLLLRRLH